MADPRLVGDIAQWKIFAAADPARSKPGDEVRPQEEDGGVWNERQALIFHFFEGLAAALGPFDQTTGPDGAHYQRGPENLWQDQGLKCENCAFYMLGGSPEAPSWDCSIVDGTIDPLGVCDLWVIPGEITQPEVDANGKPKAKPQTAARKKPKKPKKWMY